MSAHTPGPHDGTAADTVAYLAEQRGLVLAENAQLRTVNAALVAALRDILEEAEDREDTEDRPGGEGVRPNAWMIVAQLCRDALDATVGSHA